MSLTHDGTALDRLLDPASERMTPEVARWLVELRADPELQERVESLAEKSTEGLLTPEERDEYETYVRFSRLIAVLQVRARKFLAGSAAV